METYSEQNLKGLSPTQPVINAEAVKAFANNCARLAATYGHFREIFVHRGPEQAEEKRRLREVAPAFFSDLATVLIDALVLQTCRLTDQPKTHNKKGTFYNLTAKLFLNDANLDAEEQALATELHKKLQDFRDKLEHVRHKAIAHNDLNHSLNSENILLLTCGEFEKFLENLGQFLNIFGRRYLGTTYSLLPENETWELMRALQQSLWYEELRHEEQTYPICRRIEAQPVN